VKKRPILRTLVLDDDLRQAERVSESLVVASEKCGVELRIELSDNAYFAADEVDRADGDEPRWHIIFSDVVMTLPDIRGKKGVVCCHPNQQVWRIRDRDVVVWCTGSISGREGAEHGGFHLARELRKLRTAGPNRKLPHVALISSRMRERRAELAEFLPAEGEWLDFFDKDQWIYAGAGSHDPLFLFALARAVRRVVAPADSAAERTAPLSARDFVANSTAMLKVVAQATAYIQRQARSVWIHGASGTGKTAIQGWLHEELRSVAHARGDRIPVLCDYESDAFAISLFGSRESGVWRSGYVRCAMGCSSSNGWKSCRHRNSGCCEIFSTPANTCRRAARKFDWRHGSLPSRSLMKPGKTPAHRNS
jgi:hypothetical protein